MGPRSLDDWKNRSTRFSSPDEWWMACARKTANSTIRVNINRHSPLSMSWTVVLVKGHFEVTSVATWQQVNSGVVNVFTASSTVSLSHCRCSSDTQVNQPREKLLASPKGSQDRQEYQQHGSGRRPRSPISSETCGWGKVLKKAPYGIKNRGDFEDFSGLGELRREGKKKKGYRNYTRA